MSQNKEPWSFQDFINANYGRQPAEPEEVRACNCIGPQNGEPYCPCRMRGICIKNGRYVRPEQDLGPVTKKPGGDE